MSVLASTNKELSLVLRKSIREGEEQKEKAIKQIEEATGLSGWCYDFEGDLIEFQSKCDNRYRDMLGKILTAEYPNAIAHMLEREMKDSLIKEAFLEAATSKNILFTPATQKPASCSEMQKLYLQDGTLYVSCLPENLWTNMDGIQKAQLEKIL